jgi:hypothetical protein
METGQRVRVRFGARVGSPALPGTVIAFVGVPGSENECGHVQAVVQLDHGSFFNVTLDRLTAQAYAEVPA